MMMDGAAIWSGRTLLGCGADGIEGMSTFGWEYDIDYDAHVYPETTVLHSDPRRYLPPVTSIGTGETWDFSYDMVVPGAAPEVPLLSIPVTGSYTELGLESVDVGGVLYEDAWHIRSEYIMSLTTTGIFTRDYPGVADYWYVAGIGLVMESHVDIETGSIILARTLLEMSFDSEPEPEPEPEDTGVFDSDTGLIDVGGVDSGTPEMDTASPDTGA
jgi:hypothetical protein